MASGGDRIVVRGLRVLGTHGVLPEERLRAQPFEVDLVLGLDLSRAGATDALGDTVDYAEVVAAAAGVVGGAHADLLEHLAHRVAVTLLERAASVQWVEVTVTKLRPPVPHDLASVAVSVTRRREGP